MCGAEAEIGGGNLRAGNTTQCQACYGVSCRKRFCINGHDTDLWGRQIHSGGCRACIKHRYLLYTYEITLDEFIALYEFQEGRCAVCGNPLGSYISEPGKDGYSIEVDHDHKIGIGIRESIRGLLCGGQKAGCNRRLVGIDNPAWLCGALHYISEPPAQKFLAEQKTAKADSTVGDKCSAMSSPNEATT